MRVRDEAGPVLAKARLRGRLVNDLCTVCAEGTRELKGVCDCDEV